MTNTVSKLSINQLQIYLQFCGDKSNPVFNPYFHQSGPIKITWQFVSMNMTKTVCLVTTFIFCYETVLKWEMMAECKIELISNNLYFFSNLYPFSTRSMNRREQSLSRARGCPNAVPLGCMLSLLSEQLLSYFRPASRTKPLGVHHCGLCSLLELYRQGWKNKEPFQWWSNHMFIGIIEVSGLVVKDTGEDVRCHLYGGKTQTWRLFLTVANTCYEFNTGICRYLQISKPAKPKLRIIWELEEAESVLPKTNKCVCWNFKTPRLSVDKLLVVTPITMAVWWRLNVLSQTDVALCSNRKPRGRADGVSHSVNTDAAAVLPRWRLK